MKVQPLKPIDRDEFINAWTNSELLLGHLIGKAQLGWQDHAVIWSRLTFVLVATLQVVIASLWIIGRAIDSEQPIACGMGGLPLVGVAYTWIRLLKAAEPRYQSQPHRLEELRQSWLDYRNAAADAKDAERPLILANWSDVANDAVSQNEDRLDHLNGAWIGLKGSLVLLAIGFMGLLFMELPL